MLGMETPQCVWVCRCVSMYVQLLLQTFGMDICLFRAHFEGYLDAFGALLGGY